MFEISNIVEKSRAIKYFIYSLFDVFFGVVRKICSFNPYNAENIVIIALHRIGDSVFTIPAIKQVIKNYLPGKITIVCFPDNKHIYELLFPELGLTVVSYNELFWGNRLFKSSARKKIRELKPSVIIDITGAGFLIFNIRAKEIVGMSKRYFKAIYNTYSPIRKKPHLIDTYLDVIRQKIVVDDSPGSKTFSVINDYSNKKIMIHPFAGWKAKQWNFNKFIKLAEKLSLNYDVYFVVKSGEIIGSDLMETNLCGIRIIETNNIDELIKEIKNCGMFISNDSGPLYIANLLGKPTFTIYGPTNPEYSLPFGNSHAYIQKKIICSPVKDSQYCFTDAGRKGCPSFECMNLLGVDEVYSSIQEFIDKIFSEKKHEQS